MSAWSRSAAAVAVVLGGCSPAWAFHPLAHWHHHKHGKPTGFSAGYSTTTTTFVAGGGAAFLTPPGGFVAAPGGFGTGFAAPPSGFVGGFGAGPSAGFTLVPSGFVVGGTAAGFGTDAAGIFGSGIGVNLARTILCPNAGGGSPAVSAEAAGVLREIRDELKEIKSKIGGATTVTIGGGPPAPGTGGTPPTIPTTGVTFATPPGGAAALTTPGVQITFPPNFAQSPALVQAHTFANIAEFGIDNAVRQRDLARAAGATADQLKPVNDRLDALKAKIK